MIDGREIGCMWHPTTTTVFWIRATAYHIRRGADKHKTFSANAMASCTRGGGGDPITFLPPTKIMQFACNVLPYRLSPTQQNHRCSPSGILALVSRTYITNYSYVQQQQRKSVKNSKTHSGSYDDWLKSKWDLSVDSRCSVRSNPSESVKNAIPNSRKEIATYDCKTVQINIKQIFLYGFNVFFLYT